MSLFHRQSPTTAHWWLKTHIWSLNQTDYSICLSVLLDSVNQFEPCAHLIKMVFLLILLVSPPQTECSSRSNVMADSGIFTGEGIYKHTLPQCAQCTLSIKFWNAYSSLNYQKLINFISSHVMNSYKVNVDSIFKLACSSSCTSPVFIHYNL